MQIFCTQVDLLRVLALLKRAIKETTDLPILSHVLLQVEHGEARLSANNLEIAITCELVAAGAVEGAVAVPWRRLQDLAERLPPAPGAPAQHRKARDAPVELAVLKDTNTLSVLSGRSRATIRGMHASEFATVPGAEQVAQAAGSIIRLPADLFASMVSRVAFAAGTDEERHPTLTGVLLQASGRSLALTARDGYRVAACEVSLGEACQRECAVVMPAWAASECARILASTRRETRELQLVIDEQRVQASFHLPGLVLSARLQVGKGDYPLGFRQHFQHGYASRFVLGTRELAAALKSLAQVAHDDGDNITLAFERGTGPGAGRVSVGAQSQDLGTQVEVVDAVSLEGEPNQLLLKVHQLAGIVAAVETPHLALEVRTPRDPVIVRPVGDVLGLSTAYALVPCYRTGGTERG